jgi:hypothetical protein
LVLGAAVIGGIVGYAVRTIQWTGSPARSSIRASEEPIVNKALDIYGHGKISRKDLRKSFDLNVVYLPSMTCVGFNLLPGTLGGDDTICFDKSGQRVVLKYRNGD